MQRALCVRGLALGLHRRVLEVALRAVVEAEEHIAVGPLEVEGEIPSASRTRGSLNLSRRVLMKKPCVPDGVSSGSVSFFTRPSRIAGKSYSVAQTFEVNSSRKIVGAGLESFHAGGAVAEILEADLVEVPAALD